MTAMYRLTPVGNRHWCRRALEALDTKDQALAERVLEELITVLRQHKLAENAVRRHPATVVLQALIAQLSGEAIEWPAAQERVLREVAGTSAL